MIVLERTTKNRFLVHKIRRLLQYNGQAWPIPCMPFAEVRRMNARVENGSILQNNSHKS